MSAPETWGNAPQGPKSRPLGAKNGTTLKGCA